MDPDKARRFDSPDPDSGQYDICASMRENLSSGVCEQRRRRPACASTQSAQRLCYSLIGIFKFLASLCSCADWFESHFVENAEDMFFRGEAHILVTRDCPNEPGHPPSLGSCHSRHYGNRHFGTLDISGVNIVGEDIVGVDILGIDITSLPLTGKSVYLCSFTIEHTVQAGKSLVRHQECTASMQVTYMIVSKKVYAPAHENLVVITFSRNECADSPEPSLLVYTKMIYTRY